MASIKGKDGTLLNLHHWPKKDPRGKVVVVHGYGEHGARYAELGRALNEAGYDVLGYDQRGHGESGGVRGFITSFREYLDDLDLVIGESERLAPGVPRFIVAHSLGGLVTLVHTIDRNPQHAGVVLSSPFLRVKLQVPGWKVLAGKAASRIYPKLALPSGLNGAEVTRDPELARLYDVDPLNNKNATARWYTEALDAQERIFHEASAFTLPLLLMHGEKDVVADPAASAEVFPRLGSADKTLELVTGAFHEIFNEPPADRRKIIDRAISWLGAHLPVQSGARASG